MTESEINLFLKHSSYYSSNDLVNNPVPIDGQSEPFVSYFYDSDMDSEYSIIMPIYNQSDIILDSIQSIITNMVGTYEIIIIYDNCSDGSQSIVDDFFSKFNYSESFLRRVITICQETPIFETSCDNIGFKLAKSEFVIEVQADISVITYGFNLLLSRPVRTWDDVFAVSGRCTHTAFGGSGIGKMGELVEKPLHIGYEHMNKFYYFDTCNRGPLLFRRDRLKEIGYLDEQNFVLGNDDHDLMMRAKYQKNWICGYVPIEFYSPLKNGSTRKEMSDENKSVLDRRNARSNGGFLSYVRNFYQSVSLTVRDIPHSISPH